MDRLGIIVLGDIMDAKKVIEKLYADDLLYMEKCLKIRTKEGKLVPFQVNPMQRKAEQIIYEQQISKGKPVRAIFLKARQLGISTYSEGKIFKKTVTNPFRNALIIAHEDKATQNLFAMSKLFYEELPPILRPMKKYSNETALVFENPTNNDDEKYANPGLRSKITVATAKNVNTARSNTVHSLHASEVAFWDDPETLMLGLLQCVPDAAGTEVYIESTANGVGGWFYDFWKRSERGETDYIPIFLAWYENPEYTRNFMTEAEKQQFIEETHSKTYDSNGNEIKSEELILLENFTLTYEQLNWRKWCIANKCNGDLDKFHQEYPSTPDEAFVASGRPRFHAPAVQRYFNQCVEPEMTGYLKDKSGQIVFEDDRSGYVQIWKKPEPDTFYVLGGDVAEGLITGDYSCGVIIDENFNVCASWHGHIDPDLFGGELVKLAKYYNDAYIGVESNNHGISTLKAILRLEYWNIYYQKSYDKIGEQISQKIGWNTNRRTKPLMINALAEYIREHWLWIKWKTLVTEMFTYVIDDDGTTNAQQGSHDDTIMALAIALQLILEGRGENYVPEISREDLPKSMLEKYTKEGDYGAEEFADESKHQEEYGM